MSGGTGFQGTVPANYDRYLGPFMFEAYAEAIASRLPRREGLRVLELACGTGIVTQRLLRALPRGGSLVATDLSEAMLDVARRKVGADGKEWRVADACALPYGDASFDAIVVGFGLMFVPDKAKALSEARRVLAPGGVLLATTWGSLKDNAAIGKIHERMLAAFPDNPPRFLETPYGFGDAEYWKKLLADARFTFVTADRVHDASEAPSAEDVANGFLKGTPLFAALTERGADIERLVPVVAADLAKAGGDRPFRTPLVALLIEAS